VVDVAQFWQVGGELFCPPPVVADGEFVEYIFGAPFGPALNVLICGELAAEAIDARAERPGSCGSCGREAL